MVTPNGGVIDEGTFSGINTPTSTNNFYNLNMQNNLQTTSNGGGYVPYMFATVSGNNLPLPVIQERDVSQNSETSTDKGSKGKKDSFPVGVNNEKFANNASFDRHISPVDMINDEHPLEENQRRWENKSSPMFLMKNPENEQKKNNPEEEKPETMYISGVFDQLDTQLFGRYLPPYMTRNVNNNKK